MRGSFPTYHHKMKTSTLAKSACSVGLRRSFTTALLVLFALGASVQFAFAGSATWSSDPATNDWNTANNWIPNTVPNGSTDIATFDLSNTTNVTISLATTVQSAAFNAGASEYEITVSPGN